MTRPRSPYAGTTRVALAALAVLALLLPACSSPSSAAVLPPPPASVIYNPEPSSGPYVVVAIDNHFHDIHPIDDTHIAENRRFVVKNEGRNLHNFTVVGTVISVDIKPGHALVWNRLGRHLAPGFYQVACKYHAYVGMVGSFWVSP